MSILGLEMFVRIIKWIVVGGLARILLLRGWNFWRLRTCALNARSKVSRSVWKCAYNLYCMRFVADIPLEVKFAGMPCFPHGISGVFISRGAEIGRDCVIFQQVTIGSNTLLDAGGSSGGAPIVGDCCYIGAGAKLVGQIRVGHNVRVGANCCVYKDVAPNSVCVSAETRIIQKRDLDNTFYSKEPNGCVMYFRNGGWHRG